MPVRSRRLLLPLGPGSSGDLGELQPADELQRELHRPLDDGESALLRR